jgi:RNA-directed DNA polymerase
MTAEVYAGASSAGQVFRLQTRIAKAIKACRYSKVKVLQCILDHLFAAKYLAVNKVTQNKDILSLLLVH